MERLCLLIVLVVLLAGTAFGQLDTLGQDFENLIEGMGREVLPHLEQLSIWGQFPAHASYADKTGFFLTLSTGAVLSNGLFRFADDPGAFDVLNVPTMIDQALAGGPGEPIANFIQSFFPYPIIRIAAGFTLPYEIEAMIDLTGFPQLITGAIGGLFTSTSPMLGSLKLSSLHVSSKFRRAVMKDAGPFPAVSVGIGYGFSGSTLGVDLSTIDTDAQGNGQFATALGELNVKGALLVQGAVHSFGIDLQTSKQLGVFVPFVGLSSYYHIAQFSGQVGTASGATAFSAFLDYDGDGDMDVVYAGAHPSTAWVDNDLSMLLFGGFDLDLGGFALQVHSSWSIMKSWPGVSLGLRWQ